MDDKRRAELLEAKTKREETLKAATEKRADEELELEEKYSAKLGVRGVDFEIVNTAVGNFVLRKPEFIVARKYNSIPAEKQTDEDVWAYVCPCVVEPESQAVRAVFQEHGGIAHRCAIALHGLYGAHGPGGRQGKY